MFTRAIVRSPGTNFADGITTAGLGRPGYELMLEQHRAYVDCLETIGLKVVGLPAEADYPDAHFVEDTAVVTPAVAVVTHPGAPARRGEERSIEPVLARYRPMARIVPPATVDGGDVLTVGRQAFIGVSERTNAEGARQLGDILAAHGWTWTAVPVAAGLHLKSSVNAVSDTTLLLTAEFAHRAEFTAYDHIILPEGDAYAANTLWINDTLIMPAGFSAVRERLEGIQTKIVELDVSEVRKMDGGLTCLSLRL